MKIEVRRMDGKTWVALNMGLAVVPIHLLEELRKHWTGKIADAVLKGELLWMWGWMEASMWNELVCTIFSE